MLKKFQEELAKLQEQPEEKRRRARIILVVALVVPLVLIWLVSLRFIGGFRLKNDSASNPGEGFNNIKEQWATGKEGVGKAIEVLKEENEALKSQIEQANQEKEGTTQEAIQNQESPAEPESLPGE